MKIFNLIEDRQPSRFVAGRDFKLVPKSEYRGFALGYADDGKASWAVYKPVGQDGVIDKEYIRLHEVVDPKTGKEVKTVADSHNIAKMYRYTVEQLCRGKIKPKNPKVAPAEGPEGEDIEPQAKPGQPARDPNKLNEKFYGNLGGEYTAPGLKDLLCIWVKKQGNWEFFKQAGSTEEARAVARRMALATHSETAVGNEDKPIMSADGKLLGNTYTQGGQTSSTTLGPTEFPDSAQGAIQCLRAKGINTAGAVARAYDGIKGKWVVRHRGGETIVDIMHNQIQNLKEAVFFKKVTEAKDHNPLVRTFPEEKALEMVNKDPFYLFYIANPSKQVMSIAKQKFEQDKRAIIIKILTDFKTTAGYGEVKEYIKTLHRAGITWPELNTITKSRKQVVGQEIEKASKLKQLPKPVTESKKKFNRKL